MKTTRPPKHKTTPKKTTPKKAAPKKAAPKKTSRSAPRNLLTSSLDAGTPPVQSVFIRITPDGDGYTLEIFFDAAGTREMRNDTPLDLLGDGHGKIQFSFIKADGVDQPITADLVIIAQTVVDDDAPHGHRRDTPFKHPHAPANVFYPVYYIPSPAAEPDPHNLDCHLAGDAEGTIVGGTLDVIKAPNGKRSGPYKYSIVALLDGATKVANIDPSGIVNPN